MSWHKVSQNEHISGVATWVVSDLPRGVGLTLTNYKVKVPIPTHLLRQKTF